MQPSKPCFLGILAAVWLITLGGVSLGSPVPDTSYLEEPLGGGMWEYDFTVTNTSDPVTDASENLFDVLFTPDPNATFTDLSLPLGWSGDFGLGFAHLYSLDPGPPPTGTDIAPGASLGGFDLLSDVRLGGQLTYIALFVDPNGGDPIVAQGTGSPTNVPIPEPATVFLFALGAAYLLRRLVESRQGVTRS